jgi:YidC/Oxa1 family membrane protein insertase
MARHMRAQQELIFKLKDEIARLRKKHKKDPQRLASETAKLYQKHGVRPFDRGNLAGSVVQFVVGAGLYSAIRRNLCAGGRFLWIRNLSQPDAVLAVLTGAITFVASAVAQHLPEQNRVLASVIPAVMTVVLAWRLSSAVVLYWAASAATNGLQGLLLRRRD